MNKAKVMPARESESVDQKRHPSDAPVLLTADSLYKTYQLGRVSIPVLKGASLEVKAGEWIAILGASGSGKSTLLHLLGDLDQPDQNSGELSFQHRSLRTMSERERNEYRNDAIGFVFQFYHLLPELDVMQNAMLPGSVKGSLRSAWYWISVMLIGALIMPPFAILVWLILTSLNFPLPAIETLPGWVLLSGASAVLGLIASPAIWTETRSLKMRFGKQHRQMQQRAKTLLESFGLGHRLHHRPRELSGGERQRVAIARALMNEPQILLADEPTGNLDETTGGEILDLIAAQHDRGLTIVMVTHDQAIAERADRVVQLHDGRVQ